MNPFTIAFCIVSACFVAFTWMAYLRRVDIFQPERWWPVIRSFLIGCLTVVPVLLVSRYLLPERAFAKDFGGLLLDFMLRVGMIEEASKFAGFLTVFFIFRKQFGEAPNFMIHASLAALGFATVENILYFSEYGVYLVFMRGLLSTFGHMADTSLIAACLYLGLEKGKRAAIIYTVAGFLLASFSHALYNTLLTYGSGSARFWSYMAGYAVFLISLEVWAVLFNNLLNRSQYFEPQKCIDRYVVERMLSAAFVIAAIIQTVALVAEQGAAGISVSITFIVMETGFIILVITRITRFKLIRNKWYPVRPYLPFRIRRIDDPRGRPGQASSSLVIRGEEFDEYPFTRHLFRMAHLFPLASLNRSSLGRRIHAFMIEKVHLNEEDTYYLMELYNDDLGYRDFHRTRFMLRPKISGTTNVKSGSPIAGLMLLPPEGYHEGIKHSELSFLEWVVMDHPGQPRLKKWWRRMLR